MLPARHVSKIFCWASTSRPESIAPWPPPPRISQVLRQRSFDQLNDVLADVWQKLETVAVVYRISVDNLRTVLCRLLTRCLPWPR